MNRLTVCILLYFKLFQTKKGCIKVKKMIVVISILLVGTLAYGFLYRNRTINTSKNNLEIQSQNIIVKEIKEEEFELLKKNEKLNDMFNNESIFSDVINYNANLIIENSTEINKLIENSIFRDRMKEKNIEYIHIDLNGEILSVSEGDSNKKDNPVIIPGQKIPEDTLYLKENNGYLKSIFVPLYNVKYSQKAIYPNTNVDNKNGNFIITLRPTRNRAVPVNQLDESERNIKIEIIDFNTNNIVTTIDSLIKGDTLKTWRIENLDIETPYYFKIINTSNSFGGQYIIY